MYTRGEKITKNLHQNHVVDEELGLPDQKAVVAVSQTLPPTY